MLRQAESLSDTDGRDVPISISTWWDKGGFQKWSVNLCPTADSPHDLGVAPCDLKFWVYAGIVRIVQDGQAGDEIFVSCQRQVKKGERVVFLVKEHATLRMSSLEPKIKKVTPKVE